jgi:molecular chaperone GrpE
MKEPADLPSDATDPAQESSGAPEYDALRAERDEYLQQWKRAQADYQNLRRRNQLDFETAQRRGFERLFGNLLLVLDSLDMALAAPATSEDARALAAGVRLTREQLLAALEAEELRPMNEGGAFDPALHQAVAEEAAPGEAGRILATLRRGYTWKGAVLRPAQVRVSARAND